MILVEVCTWWYSTGWMGRADSASKRVGTVLEFFSVGLLLRTLFDPFRQIDAGRVRGSLQDEWRAFGNRLFSRIVGAVIRMFVIFAGLVSALFVIILGLVQFVCWPLLPVLPVLGLVLMLTGQTL